jgi:hypothetical protein
MGRGFVSTCLTMFAAAALASCGGGSGNTGTGGSGGPPIGGNVGTPGTGPYQPMAVGAVWTYHVADQSITYDKDSTVESMEDIGGPKAGITGFKVRETIKGSIQLTWYQVVDTGVVRHHDQTQDTSGNMLSDEWYDPYLLRTDESSAHLQAGAAWTIDYNDTKTTSSKPTATIAHQESWHVDATDEAVTVPAGSFTALKVTRTDPTDGSTKTQWFVRGVGKVREQTGAGHVEELTSYQVPAQ